LAAPALLPENTAMQVVERSALVTYTAAQMFALVNDVERYPDFLPWCIGAQVQDVSASERRATLRVARGVLQAEFTTLNQLTPGARIQMRLMHGPFSDLSGEWRFDDIGGAAIGTACIGGAAIGAAGSGTSGSKVQFRIEFEFKNRLTAAAFSAVFESLCGTIVDAFAMRARKVYG
jgi:ribosome-associated toxin RatA of RatAB toxin-antitoxin module